MEGYLCNALSLEEYRLAKGKIINEKKQKEEEMAELERHRSGWFEPAIRFTKSLKTAEILESSHDHAKKLEFAKTTGSNFRLVNRELVSLPRDAWQLVVDQGSFAHHNAAPEISGAAFSGETHHVLQQRRGGDSNRPKSTISCASSIYTLKPIISRIWRVSLMCCPCTVFYHLLMSREGNLRATTHHVRRRLVRSDQHYALTT
jgi:hypothetical protein